MTRASNRLRQVTQLYDALARCNQAIVRGRDEHEVFSEICRAAVESGSIEMAWIGLVDPATGRVNPAAAYGAGTDYLDGLEITVGADDPRGRGPMGTCIRTDRPVWVADLQHEPSLAPWRARIEARGWNSVIALPLHRRGEAIGAMALYAYAGDAFEDQARALLTEMARDVDFALDNLARESEREQAQRALRESEARLVKAQAIARMGFLDWDLRTNEIYWSDEVVRMFGVAPGQNLQTIETTTALAHPEDRALVERQLKAAIAGEQPYAIEHRMLRSDGAVVWVDAQAELIRDADGTPARLLGTIVDITERKRVELALRASETRLRAMIEAEPECVKIVDPSGIVRDMNTAGLAMLEAASMAQLGDRPLDTFVLPGHRAAFRALHHRVLNGESGTIEFEIEGLRGTRRWLETHAVPLRDEQGAVDALLGVTRDITERKRAEAELHLQSSALNAAADAIVITDAGGTIVWANPAFTALTGYSPEEAVGQNPRALVKSGVQDGAFYGQMWATIVAGRTWRGELINRRRDGTLYPEDLTITPVRGAGGRITHFVAVKRDLTQQRQLEEQFLQAQKMEIVGRLAGGIAHDFNNLITVINGTIELLTMTRADGDPLADDLQTIRQAGERAAELTRQLLAFSRKQIMKPEVLHLNTRIAGTAPILRRVIGEDVKLVLALASDLGFVRADGMQLDQVILNLAVNARDAMPHGGTLTLETANVVLDDAAPAGHPAGAPGPHVMLAIHDTGVGMDADTRRRIFEPFFTTKGLGRGTGLGLSTVYGIVKQSGGSITVESERGRGTTFRVYFPRVEGIAAEAPPAPHETGDAGTETVLVVEDEPGLRTLVERALRGAGFTVLTAANGADAVSLMERPGHRVDLLLTDVVLPGMNGRELAARLAAVHPGLRVLYTSGYTDDTVLRHGVSARTAHFLPKPYTVSQLTHKVREVLDAPRPSPQAPAA